MVLIYMPIFVAEILISIGIMQLGIQQRMHYGLVTAMMILHL